MAAAKHDPEFRERMGIPKSVADEYVAADSKSGRLSRAMKSKKRRKKGPDGGGRHAKQHRQAHG